MTRPPVTPSLLAGPAGDHCASNLRRHLRRSRIPSLAALLLAGCLWGRRPHAEVSPAPAPARPIDALTIPGTYATGASCGQDGGDEVFLTILPSHVFSMRQAYRDTACHHLISLVYLGAWAASADGRRLTLDAGPPWLRVLAIVDAHTLRVSTPSRDPPGVFRVERVARPVHLVDLRPPFRPFGPALLQ
jgi:hypothetical protein